MELIEEDFFPSRIIEFETMVERSDWFDTWETIVIKSGIEIGPRRIVSFFLNGEKSLILQYIFWAKKRNYLFARRKISVEVFYGGIDYTRERLNVVEEAMERSIERENIPDYHKEDLFSILYREMDKAFDYMAFSPKERTRILKEN